MAPVRADILGRPDVARSTYNEREKFMSQKIAYVTGGMGGIGTAICQRLAKDGFTVVAGCGPNSPRKDKWLADQAALGFKFTASEGNVSDWDSTVAAFAKVRAEIGEVDVLVNNAGITRDGVFRKMRPEDWKAVIDTNLNSLFFVTRQVVDGMLERGWGRIINISSMNGQKGQFGQSNYSTAKAGMHGFTMSLAHGVARLYRHRHGQGDPGRRVAEDRRHHSGQAPRHAGGDCINGQLAGIGRRRICHRGRLLPERRQPHGLTATAGCSWFRGHPAPLDAATQSAKGVLFCEDTKITASGSKTTSRSLPDSVKRSSPAARSSPPMRTDPDRATTSSVP